jgi:P-type Cu2+ transporter
MVVCYEADRVDVDAILQWLCEPRPASAVRSAPVDGRASGAPLRNLAVAAAGLLLTLFGAPAVASTAVVVVGAIPIARRALEDAREGELSADLLDATAFSVLLLRGSVLAGAIASVLISFGEYIRTLTARRSRRAVVDLFASMAPFAWVLRNGRTERVPADSVEAGTTVVVHPGEVIPVDGPIVLGRATVDQQALTGEATPLLRLAGDDVFASTLVMDGEIRVQAQRTAGETRASRIVEVLANAPIHDTAIENYAARFAGRLVVPVLLLAGGIYALTRDIVRAIAVVVFDFSTGIRVSVPTCVLTAMNAGVRRQVLIKSGRAVEQLARVDTIVFDKTGTLTMGTPVVREVIPLVDDLDEDALLALAAAVENRLSHPAAHAIVREAEERNISIPVRHESRYEIGLGVEAWVEGAAIAVGCEEFLRSCDIELPQSVVFRANELGRSGTSTVFVARDENTVGMITYADVPRTEMASVIGALHSNGIREVLMVTGDHRKVARAIAHQVGIERVEAASFPDRKAEIVRELQAQGRTVAVVGDGINDSPALAYADVSVSLACGTDVARETADVILYRDLWGLLDAITLARFAMGVVRENLWIIGTTNGLGLLAASLGFVSHTAATAIHNGTAALASTNSLRPLLARSLAVDEAQHETHDDHPHVHGNCDHIAVRHGNHIDYLHDGHLHAVHDGHIDEHPLAINIANPAGCTPHHHCGAHDATHAHGIGCGHDPVPHGDHTDYLVAGHLHHAHSAHCDDHGTLAVA